MKINWKYWIYMLMLCAFSHSIACQQRNVSDSVSPQDWTKEEENKLISVARKQVLSNRSCQEFLRKAQEQISSVDVKSPLHTVQVSRGKEVVIVTFEHNDLPSDGPWYRIMVQFYKDGRVGVPQCKEEWSGPASPLKVKSR